MATTINGHPPSFVNAQDKVDNIMDRDASKGRVAVHTFNPDAPPEEKAAAAGKAKDKLKSVNDSDSAGTAGAPRGKSLLCVFA